MPVPAANVLYCFDWGKFTVVNIDVVSDSNEWLVNICDWEYFETMFFNVSFVQLSNLFV